jgi:2',3'-cyclic-nucleotide 2'-phosphodiesterase (5'-nucleotidase family)
MRGGAAAASLPLGAQAQAAPSAAGIERFTLTVLGTTDLHNNVFNWDYFKSAPYADYPGNNVGIAQAATLIKAIRAERGAANTLTIDAGDTIQGTPLAYYFAKISPASDSVKHPMALAMNAVGYDAVALGNHEFNYGVPLLRTWEAAGLPAPRRQRPCSREPAARLHPVYPQAGQHRKRLGDRGDCWLGDARLRALGPGQRPRPA